MFVPYSLLQNLLNVDTKREGTEFCTVGTGVLDGPISGVLDGPISGVLNGPISGVLNDPISGVLDGPISGALGESFFVPFTHSKI